MSEIKRILVISEMTQLCREAVNQAISQARHHNAELYVLHVVHNPFGLQGWNLPGFSVQEDYKKILWNAKTDLDWIIREEGGEGLNVEVLIEKGEPTTQILKVAKEKEIDLIVLRAQEEGRIEHFLFGSGNEDLIRRMPCSFMLVKHEPEPVAWD